VEVTNALVEVIGEIVAKGNEPEAHHSPRQAQQGRQNGQQGANGTESAVDAALEVAASSVRLATVAARHTWNKVLVRPK
jgi:hypothetical protein